MTKMVYEKGFLYKNQRKTHIKLQKWKFLKILIATLENRWMEFDSLREVKQ